MPNPAQQDPTRTTTLRKTFIMDMRKRFRLIRKAVVELIVTEDAFGLRQNKVVKASSLIGNTRWQFESDGDKVKEFRKWLKLQIDTELLGIEDGVDPLTPWTSKYITSAYKQGATRSYTDARSVDLNQPAGFTEGTKAQFLQQSFAGPVGVRQLELLSTRSFEQLRGIDSVMSAQLSRELSDGFANGLGPRKIARNITKAISKIEKTRALTIARTEIINAYAEGQLDSLEALGVRKIKVMAEWLTAGDDRVCPRCNALEGVVLTIKEARGLLPRHPNCRCAWLPADVDESKKGQKRGKASIEAAFERSIKSELPKRDVFVGSEEARRRTSWIGADKVIGFRRGERVVAKSRFGRDVSKKRVKPPIKRKRKIPKKVLPTKTRPPVEPKPIQPVPVKPIKKATKKRVSKLDKLEKELAQQKAALARLKQKNASALQKKKEIIAEIKDTKKAGRAKIAAVKKKTKTESAALKKKIKTTAKTTEKTTTAKTTPLKQEISIQEFENIKSDIKEFNAVVDQDIKDIGALNTKIAKLQAKAKANKVPAHLPGIENKIKSLTLKFDDKKSHLKQFKSKLDHANERIAGVKVHELTKPVPHKSIKVQKRDVLNRSNNPKTVKRLEAWTATPEEIFVAQDYTGAGARELNTTLRTGYQHIFGRTKADLIKQDKILTDLIKKQPKIDKTVYRGIASGEGTGDLKPEQFLKAYTNNEKITLKGYSSTSIDFQSASNFAVGKQRVTTPLVFEIRTKKGIYVEHITRNKDELEVILPKDMQFRVVNMAVEDIQHSSGIKKRGYVIKLEEISENL